MRTAKFFRSSNCARLTARGRLSASLPVCRAGSCTYPQYPLRSSSSCTLFLPYLSQRQFSFKIAKDRTILEGLNSGALGNSRVGKFMTIYPPQELARNVAEELAALTESFHGPVIPTDLRVGTILYARYGGFSPIVRRDRLGRYHLQIETAGGVLQDDEYKVAGQLLSENAIPCRS